MAYEVNPRDTPPPSYHPPEGPDAGPSTGPGPVPALHQSAVAYYNQPPNQQFHCPAQPGYGAPNYGAGPAPAQQQQQQVVVVGGGVQPQAVIVQQVQSFAGHMFFACFVLWCCNFIFGLIAFILAMVASNNAVSDPTGARKFGHASNGVSSAGILVTIIVVIIVVSVMITNSSYYCTYTYNGNCYDYRTYVGRFGTCYGDRSSTGYCYCSSYYQCT